MDCQYEYVPVDPSDHYGFLPDYTGDCIDPMAEKGIDLIADFGLRNAECS
jgi:hypothetical protein